MKRIENILRHQTIRQTIEVADISILPEEGSVKISGQEVNLTKKEYDILLFWLIEGTNCK